MDEECDIELWRGEGSVFYPPEWIGQVDVTSGVLRIGNLDVADVGDGYPTANVFVERIGGKKRRKNDQEVESIPGFPVAKIHIEIIGDGWAQAELDAQNEEAMRDPRGPKEYWRAKGFVDEDEE